MRVEFLGSCANQTADREAVAFTVENDGSAILVDAGPGIVRQINRAGKRCADIDTVIVTHSHGDHTSGFAYLIWTMFYDRLSGGGGAELIRVIGLPDVLAGVRAFLEFCYDPSAFPFEIEYHEVSGDGHDDLSIGGNVRLRTVPVIHTAPNIGMRFDCGDRSLAYSCDTLYCEEFVDLAAGAQLMIHEAFVTSAQEDLSQRTRHATAAEAGRAAESAGAGMLALVHTFPPLIGREDELVDEAATQYGGQVFVPAEFESVMLPQLERQR